MSRIRDSYRPAPISGMAVQNVPSGQFRHGGRSANTLRPTRMQTGVVSQASGSAYVEVGQCKVICGVYGPREASSGGVGYSESGVLQCDLKFAGFAKKEWRKAKGQQLDERQMSRELQTALSAAVQLHRFPKSVIDVYVVVLQDDGNVMSTAATAGSLALTDAGVDMYDLVVGSAAAKINVGVAATNEDTESANAASSDDTLIVVDPSAAEEVRGQAIMSLTFMPSAQKVTQMMQSGEMTPGDTSEALQLCLDGCEQVYRHVVKTLMEAAARKQKTTVMVAKGDAGAGGIEISSQ